jgi:hypothetical protein
MDAKITDISYSVFSNKGAFALFLGSGISRAAGIPTGWDITLNLIQQISILEKQKTTGDLDQWYEKHFKEKADYSNILEKLTSTTEERINVLKSYFEPTPEEFKQGLKRATVSHQKIAQLVQGGYIKVIVTTNFDRLIENALKDVGIEPVVISNPSHIENTIPIIHSRVTLVKINGDYLDTRFLNIKSELAQYDERIENFLRLIFENFGLITCGWSAKWDISLIDILKSANKYRYSNYFAFTSKATAELEDLCKFRGGKLVKIQSADQLFNEVAENIHALENNVMEDPLSPKIALARVKKYLSKEEYVISLSEIINNVTENCFQKLNAITFPNLTQLVDVRGVLDLYFRLLEPILPLMVEGGYWAKEYNARIWMNAIGRMGSFQDRNSKYRIEQQMKYFPLIIIRYAFGLACLANRNWHMLKHLFSIKIKNRHGRDYESLLLVTHVWRVIDTDDLKTILQQRYHTPMSELLFTELRKYFIHIIPSDDDFVDLFDYYEYVCCLVLIAEKKDEYPSLGRFAWRNREYINTKLAEASTQGNDFELISSGLLHNLVALNSAVDKIKETISKGRFF